MGLIDGVRRIWEGWYVTRSWQLGRYVRLGTRHGLRKICREMLYSGWLRITSVVEELVVAGSNSDW